MAQAHLLAKACRAAPNRGRTTHDPRPGRARPSGRGRAARPKQAGIRVPRPYDHGFCTSIYFKGPDGEQLEVTYQTRPLGAEELDAETFRALGISDEERAAMTR